MNTREILERLTLVRSAQKTLRSSSAEKKNAVLKHAAQLLRDRERSILDANALDLAAATALTPALRDRLTLNPSRVNDMIEGLGQVASLPDPVGEVAEAHTLSNGLKARRVRSPLGVILMIYESRPNVAIEAFSLAFKAGNCMILRGGKESMKTTAAIYALLHEALQANGFSRDCLYGVTDPDRKITEFLLQCKDRIDIVVPRGGDSLIEFVTNNTRIPVIKNDRGLCHVYVHEDADLAVAERIVMNSKCQRPGVCNAMETLLVSEKIAEKFLKRLHAQPAMAEVSWYGCPRTCKIIPEAMPAKPENWDTEYLDLKMNCKVVASLDEAIQHIETHGSRHSEVIVTTSQNAARRFQDEIDAAAVYWNASSRFTDGFELGLGGELGISTQKLHVRGPIGLKELTSVRWIFDGQGQIRG